MTEPEPPSEIERLAAHMMRTERLFLRVSVWQTVLSVVGALIGVLALYAALTESAEVRKQTEAAVWPYLQVTVSNFGGPNPRGAIVEFSFTNAGVGPAHLRAVRVTADGQARTSWEEIMALSGIEDDHVNTNTVSNYVFQPGETLVMLGIRTPAFAEAFLANTAETGNAYIDYCYCSIFDACWLADSRVLPIIPKPVAQCPDYGPEAFQG
ncbi:MAG: hypothetical protein ACFB2Z_12545 [Maricaulaceae bacterium]